ncbi:enoyl-CoA hydratase/isomerase family protein [Curtobacterium pusillum]|uniref:enoyl-CoA hydratase/isomerase family protein n=1 Tax=Curtobacterium pusillum TaxID=69373 RepID=UPI0011A199FB|nr:enoyl-CoA hydratase/isomerase family protein [Curtobacterium pusillum]
MPQLVEVAEKYPTVNVHQGVSELLRGQPRVSIVKLAGVACAAGAEFVVAADMTLAAAETVKLAQNEALLGIMPGGDGTQDLREWMGRARALGAVVGADLVDAATVAQHGWINRALRAAELDSFVDTIAHNIASIGAHVVAGVKKALPSADLTEGLRVENDARWALVQHERAQKNMGATAELDVQTRVSERDIEGLLRRVASQL